MVVNDSGSSHSQPEGPQQTAANSSDCQAGESSTVDPPCDSMAAGGDSNDRQYGESSLAYPHSDSMTAGGDSNDCQAGGSSTAHPPCDSVAAGRNEAECFPLPLCWRCPLELRSEGGRQLTVQSPGDLLNLPINLRCETLVTTLCALFVNDFIEVFVRASV